ncbi:MAG: transketolase family protein [Coprobacillaceae bacterium]
MTFKLVEDRSTKGRELRLCVVETLQSLMDKNKQVLALEADLGGASGFTKIEESHHEQFIQCGIAEANMVGVAAGLSLEGYIPFLHTFGPFASRRVYDQLFVSGAYAKTTINIYGSDPGFCVGTNGGTHTTFEDIALMRSIPEAIVCDAADDTQLQYIIETFASLKGIHYVRANRKDVRNVYKKDSTFTIGKANILKTGKDVTIIACGQLISEALDCAERLEKEGVSTTVIDMFTIKPLDVNSIIEHCQNKKAIVTFENHSIIGGLGSAVSEVIAENNIQAKFKRVGVKDRFGEVGSPDYLQKTLGLTTEDLYNEIKKLI